MFQFISYTLISKWLTTTSTETMDSLGIPRKITRLVGKPLDKRKNKAQNEISEEFVVSKGQRQGDALSWVAYCLTYAWSADNKEY